MNDLPDLSHLGPGWDNSAADAAAVSAYARAKESPTMQRPRSRTTADVILSGVRSCFLALETIRELEFATHPTPQAMVSAARQVLTDWGIEVKPREVPPDPIPNAEPPPVPGVVPSATEPTESVELKWPPPAPTLPGVYTENYYHPRESHLVWPAHDGPGARFIDNPSVPIGTGDRLVFKGSALWWYLEDCWLMRMTVLPNNTMLDVQHVWVLSKHIKPGDEIPSVIAAAQAKSTDP